MIIIVVALRLVQLRSFGFRHTLGVDYLVTGENKEPFKMQGEWSQGKQLG